MGAALVTSIAIVLIVMKVVANRRAKASHHQVTMLSFRLSSVQPILTKPLPPGQSAADRCGPDLSTAVVLDGGYLPAASSIPGIYQLPNRDSTGLFQARAMRKRQLSMPASITAVKSNVSGSVFLTTHRAAGKRRQVPGDANTACDLSLAPISTPSCNKSTATRRTRRQLEPVYEQLHPDTPIQHDVIASTAALDSTSLESHQASTAIRKKVSKSAGRATKIVRMRMPPPHPHPIIPMHDTTRTDKSIQHRNIQTQTAETSLTITATAPGRLLRLGTVGSAGHAAAASLSGTCQ